MTNEQAQKIYLLTLAPTMIVFLALCLLMAFGSDWFNLPEPFLTGIGVVAGLTLVNAIWAHWRFMNRIDEFLHSIQIKAVLFGLAVILVIATVWGVLELYLNSPALPIFYLNPIYWAAYGLAAVVLSKQAGVDI